MPGLFAFWRSCTHCVLRFNQSESTRTKEKPARQPVSPKENRPLQPAGVRRLPDNPSLLKALVSAQQAKIEHLKFVIAKLRRMQFGRRSEQMDETVTQLELGSKNSNACVPNNRATSWPPVWNSLNPLQNQKQPYRPNRNASRCRIICHVKR